LFIKKIVTESDVVQKVLDWVEGEKNRAKAADLRKMNKETQASSFLKRIENFDDATSKNRDECTIFFAEGLSAANSLVASRDSKVHGAFPLRGKILNVRDADAAKIIANEEIKNIMAIIGLKMGQKVPEKDDGEWYVIEIDGKEYCVNENDVINHNGSHINVSELI
jgi:DNA gyrase/topoisomerase IV subunit B